MTVKELIEYLSNCNLDYNVVDENEVSITEVVEHTNHADPTNNFVMLW